VVNCEEEGLVLYLIDVDYMSIFSNRIDDTLLKLKRDTFFLQQVNDFSLLRGFY